MIHPRLQLPVLAATAVPIVAATALCLGVFASSAGADSPASISVQTELVYKVSTLTINGTATCAGGGTAGVDVRDGSLEQMFQGGIGGMAIQLDGPVTVDCDGAAHNWSGNLIAPGRILPNNSGGQVTVNLTQGQTILATTGPHGVYIVS